MDDIIIECSEMDSVQSANRYLCDLFGWREDSVSDAESLLEMLQSIAEPCEITFEDEDLLEVNLGDYGDEILDAFEQAENTNENIRLV